MSGMSDKIMGLNLELLLPFRHQSIYNCIYHLPNKEHNAVQTLIAKVFTSGNSQAVRLPRQFRLETDEVFISRHGNSLVLTPRMVSWEGFLEGLTGFSEDFAVGGGLTEDCPRRGFDG